MAGHPTRAGILVLLEPGERTTTALGAEFNWVRNTIVPHLHMLQASRLVEGRRDGHNMFHSLTAAGRAMVRAIRTLE